MLVGCVRMQLTHHTGERDEWLTGLVPCSRTTTAATGLGNAARGADPVRMNAPEAWGSWSSRAPASPE